MHDPARLSHDGAVVGSSRQREEVDLTVAVGHPAIFRRQKFGKVVSWKKKFGGLFGRPDENFGPTTGILAGFWYKIVSLSYGLY